MGLAPKTCRSLPQRAAAQKNAPEPEPATSSAPEPVPLPVSSICYNVKAAAAGCGGGVHAARLHDGGRRKITQRWGRRPGRATGAAFRLPPAWAARARTLEARRAAAPPAWSPRPSWEARSCSSRPRRPAAGSSTARTAAYAGASPRRLLRRPCCTGSPANRPAAYAPVTWQPSGKLSTEQPGGGAAPRPPWSWLCSDVAAAPQRAWQAGRRSARRAPTPGGCELRPVCLAQAAAWPPSCTGCPVSPLSKRPTRGAWCESRPSSARAGALACM